MKLFFERYKMIFIACAALVIVFFYWFNQFEAETISGSASLIHPEPLEEPVVQESKGETELAFFVDLKGAVKHPGLYEAKEGERVFDIIERSGGVLESADVNQVNFAERVQDEMVIYIPEAGEVEGGVFSAGFLASHSKDGKVNLNKADSTELETLPGIGPAKSQAIIEYREQNGPFQQVEDIQKISGIGAKTFEKLEELITVR